MFKLVLFEQRALVCSYGSWCSSLAVNFDIRLDKTLRLVLGLLSVAPPGIERDGSTAYILYCYFEHLQIMFIMLPGPD